MVLSIISCFAHNVVLLIGETGPGKSSMVNFIYGNITAIEGHTFDSETSDTHVFCHEKINMCIIDTPGLFDNRGYSNEDILHSIEAEVIRQSIIRIQSVLIMIDGTSTKIRVKHLVEGLISMFNESVLSSVVFVVNKKEKLNASKEKEIMNYIVDELGYIFPNDLLKRIVFVDTKGSYSSYFPTLNASIQYCTPFTLNVIKEKEKKITGILSK